MPEVRSRLNATHLVLAIWCAVLAVSVLTAQDLPSVPTKMSTASAVAVILMPMLVFGVSAFWAQHSPFYNPRVAQFIDERLGTGAFASFLVRLRPLLLFGTAAIIQGTIGLAEAIDARQAVFYMPAPFFLSGGLAFALVHFILYKRRVLGVYPVRGSTAAPTVQPPAPVRAPLREAFPKYWWMLIGIALFPSALVIGIEIFHIAFEFFALPFFAAALLAGWPTFSGRATYAFWLVAIGVYMLGALLAAALLQLVHAMT